MARLKLVAVSTLVIVVLAGLAPAVAVPSEKGPSLDILKDLSPLPSGPGVFVCDPVGPGLAPELLNFGAGVSRWLDFTLGSILEMDRTQAWSIRERLPQELGQPNLRVPLSRAPGVGRIVGVPYTVTGSIAGTASKCILAYVLTSTETGKAEGTPFQVSGTLDEICASLPGLAKSVAERLKVPPPAVATPRADDLTFDGGMDWPSKAALSPVQRKQALDISGRLPVMALMLLDDTYHHHYSNFDLAVMRTLQATPDNTQILAEVCRNTAAELWRVGGQVVPLLKNHPNNYLLCRTQVRIDASIGDLKAQLASSVHLVRIAPKSTLAWSVLAETLGDLADSVRHARYWSELTDEEADYASSVYPFALAARERVVRLDPLFADAWRSLAAAATFAGDGTRADQALWKALQLDPSLRGTYLWGLQMYQPKWLDNPAKLRKIADMAAKRQFADTHDDFFIADGLMRAGFPALAKPHYDHVITALRADIVRYPRTTTRRLSLASALWGSGQRDEALKVCEQAVSLEPGSEAATKAQKDLDYYRSHQVSAK